MGASLLGLTAALMLREGGRSVRILDRAPPPPSSEPPPSIVVLPASALEVPTSLAFQRFEAVRGGVRVQLAAADTAPLWRRQLARCRASGIDLRWSCEVFGVRADEHGIRSVRTSAGPLPTGAVVLTAGSRNPRLASSVGLQLPIVPERSYWWAVSDAVPSDAPPPDPGGDGEALIVRDRRIGTLIGRFRSFGPELAGTRALAFAHLDRVARGAGVTSPPNDPPWVVTVHAHNTADHRPVIGRVPGVTGLFVGTLHGSDGNAHAESAARALAAAVLGDAVPAWAEAWSSERIPQTAPGGRKVVTD